MIDTREAILQSLAFDGPAVVEEIAERVAPMGVELNAESLHRPLRILLGEGMVQRIKRHHGRGRPKYRYSITLTGANTARAARAEMRRRVKDLTERRERVVDDARQG